MTLHITYPDQAESQVYWVRDEVTIAQWTVGRDAPPPQIAPQHENVLKLEGDGSLTFINVALNSSGTYYVTVVQVGAKEGKTSFTLIVYGKHIFKNDIKCYVTCSDRVFFPPERPM